MQYPSFSYPAPGQRRRGPIGYGAPYAGDAGGTVTPTGYPDQTVRPVHSGYTAVDFPSVEGVPYLPAGARAPSPQYIDQVHRMGEAADYRQSRQANFDDSVRRNNQQAATSAGAFSFAHNQLGQSPTQARATAYTTTHPAAPSAPYTEQGYGQVGQAPPTYVVPQTSGRGASNWRGVPFPVPAGSNVVGAGYPGAGAKPANPVDRSTAYKNYLGKPITDPATGEPKYAMKPEDALKGADEDMARSGQPGAAAQPQQPSAPMNPVKGPEEPYGTRANIPIGDVHARMMYQVLQQQNPNLNPGQVGALLQQHLSDHYGVAPGVVGQVYGKELRAGHLGLQYAQAPADVSQGPRVPVSMLGPTNGMDPSQRYGSPRQATPGPSIPTQPTARAGQPGAPIDSGVTEGRALNGANPVSAPPAQAQAQQATSQPAKITRAAAAQYLQLAGGDRAKAAAMIQQHGFDLSQGYAD